MSKEMPFQVEELVVTSKTTTQGKRDGLIKLGLTCVLLSLNFYFFKWLIHTPI
jgi:hypothetical protein